MHTFTKHIVKTTQLLLICSLSGCIQSMGPAYIPSTDSNAAKVTFISHSGGINMAALSWKGPTQGCACSNEPAEVIGVFFNKAVLVKQSNRYADKGKHTNRFSVHVTPDKQFRFSVPIVQYDTTFSGGLLQTTTYYCQAHESFTPDANAEYEVVYDLNTNECGFSVYKLDKGLQVQIKTNKYPLCSNTQNPAWDDWVNHQIIEKCTAQQ